MYERFAYKVVKKIDHDIKKAPFFPVRTGFLRDSGTYAMQMPSFFESAFACVKFDSAVAPYIPALETGSRPHDIPNAFGWGIKFGIGGRFDGKFHPGSMKHVGFISHDCYSLAKSTALEMCQKRFHVLYAEEI